MPFSEHSFNARLEALKLVIRDEREGCAGEAAAVDAHRSLAREKLLAERNRKRHVLLLDVARRGHVLQKRPGRHAGLVDVVQKLSLIHI